MSSSLTHQLRVFGSVASSTLEAWRGTNVVHQARQPEKYLQLYDMEGSPYCRFVREAFTALGLDVQILPCPAGGKRFPARSQETRRQAAVPAAGGPQHRDHDVRVR